MRDEFFPFLLEKPIASTHTPIAVKNIEKSSEIIHDLFSLIAVEEDIESHEKFDKNHIVRNCNEK